MARTIKSSAGVPAASSPANLSPTPSTATAVSRIDKACTDFETEQETEVQRIDLKTPLEFPKLGPSKNLGKDDLKAYTRVVALLKYVQYLSNAPWDGHSSSKSWDVRMEVDASHVSDWMLPKDTFRVLAPDEPSKPASLQLPSRPAIHMAIA